MNKIFLSISLLIIYIFIRIVWCLITSKNKVQPYREKNAQIKTLIVLGSGGHTGEMLSLLKHFNRARYCPLTYVRAVTDSTSEVRIRAAEEAQDNLKNVRFCHIPRSREVGQSYFTSIFSTLHAMFYSMWLVFQTNPELVTNKITLPLAVVCMCVRVCVSISLCSICCNLSTSPTHTHTHTHVICMMYDPY